MISTKNSLDTYTVEAPEETGNYKFVTWTDGRGDDVTAGDRLLSIDNLDDDRKRIAEYEYVGPIPSKSLSSWTIDCILSHCVPIRCTVVLSLANNTTKRPIS